MKKTISILGATVLLVSLTGCSAPFNTFQRAQSSCSATSGISILDNGKTLVIDMMGEDEYVGASYTDVICVISAVNTPGYIVSQMQNTRAMDGMQSAEYDGISVQWNYHPDSGLDVTYHKE